MIPHIKFEVGYIHFVMSDARKYFSPISNLLNTVVTINFDISFYPNKILITYMPYKSGSMRTESDLDLISIELMRTHESNLILTFLYYNPWHRVCYHMGIEQSI